MTAALATTPAAERQGIILWAGQHYGVDTGKVLPILKSTCFKSADGKEPTDAEVAALLIVAREHKLNPFLREIYAFPAKGGGIVPIVGIDGWISIVNGHPQYNGVEFIYDNAEGSPQWVECHMYRKDRSHPIKVRELMAECRRDTMPWKSHPARMLRHKAFIQCARVAFGFAGIYDPDEGEAIVEAEALPAPQHQPQRGAAGLKAAVLQPAGTTAIPEDKTIPQKEKLAGTLELRDRIVGKFPSCNDLEILALARDEANLYDWTPADQEVIDTAYRTRQAELNKGQ